MIDPLVETKAIKTKLSKPPLERVLAAVAFSPVLKIADASGAGIAPFQEAIRADYPHVELEHETEIELQIAEGRPNPTIRQKPVWRLFDRTREWRISLTSDSIALETQRAYAGRDDFVEKLLRLTLAVEDAFHPAEAHRVGVRYLNVFGVDKMKRVSDFVRSEFLAFGCSPYLEHLHNSNSVSQFNIPEGTLFLKHGILGAGLTHELLTQPSQHARWYFDVDAWCSLSGDFDASIINDRINSLTKRTGTLFNWATTPKFMEAYKCQPSK